MKDIFLPQDIKKYVRKKVLSKVLYFILLELVAFFVNFVTFKTFNSIVDGWIHVLIIIAIQLIPFAISKFPFNLIDKSWSGEVVSVDIETKPDAFMEGGRPIYYTKHEIILGVKREDGNVIKIVAKEVGEKRHVGFSPPNAGNIKLYIDYYSVGDKVYHFYGIKNYYIVRNNALLNDCIICGAQNPTDRDNCFNCGHTLLK